MLSLGKFSSQAQCNGIILHNLVSKVFVLPAKTHHQIQFSFSPNGMSRLGCCGLFARKRAGFCLYASKNQRKSDNELVEVDGFEDFDEDDNLFQDEEEDFEEGEGLIDDDEEFIPLNNMKKWMKNKPRGFGEGKVYDTSVEDKLMEEIEQSRRAQLANINNLKNNPLRPSLIQEIRQLEKALPEKRKDGFQVRLVHLPKKMNIHKDLKLAFKGVPGIVEIVPVVTGNKKTRDPVCKGFAFIKFRSENDAYRFVQSFTGKMIMFGKVMKEIKCEMTTDLLEQGYEQYVAEKTSHNAEKAECSFSPSIEDVSVEIVNQHNIIHESTKAEDDQKIDSEAIGQLESRRHCDREIKEEVNLISSSSIVDVSVEFVNQDISMHELTRAEDDRKKDSEAKGQLESTQDGDQETKEEVNLISSSSLKKNQEKQEKGKKVASERKKKNAAKFNIPGSAKRLKIREKELLIGVFSKYGANASLDIQDNRAD